MSGPDMRKHPRLGPIIIKAQFENEVRQGEGYLTNVSTGGVFLAVEELPSMGEVLRLRITLPWRLGNLTAEAKVVWSGGSGDGEEKQQPRGVGLQFTDLSPKAEESLRLYLRKFSELAAKLDEPA